MNRDDLIRAYRTSASSWQVLVGVYVLLLGAMALSASAIL